VFPQNIREVTMYKQKFLDGTPVDADYAAKIAVLVSGACDATDLVSEDDLEEFAATSWRREQQGPAVA